MSWLYMRLQDLDKAMVPWALRQGSMEELGQSAATELSALAARHRVVLIVPADDILLTEVSLPTRNRAQMQKAVPFALEDSLIEPVENLHFVLGKRLPNGSCPVAVVAKERLAGWLECCQKWHLEPDLMAPESLFLPAVEGHPEQEVVTIVLTGERALVRHASEQGFAIERDNLPLILGRLAADAESPIKRIELYATERDSDAQWLSQQFPWPCQERHYDTELALFARRGTHPALNLLQGQRRQGALRMQWQRWRLAAILLILSSISGLVYVAVDYRQMGQQIAQLQQENERVFRSSFPNVLRVVNIRTQTQQRLRAARKHDGVTLLSLLNPASHVLETEKDLTLTALRFQNQELTLTVEVARIEQLEQMKQRLQKQSGVQVEVRSVRAEQDQVRGDLRIRTP